jgi:predicted ATPase
MDIIEKIEIKHFRSFDGGKDQEKVRIENLKDLNVFSGSNDSGKSNVLRALNLFFNDEISPGIPFDKKRDFSKIVSNRFDNDIEERKISELERIENIIDKGGHEKPRDLRRSDEVITIKIHFNNKERQRRLPEKFWISKSYSQKNNFQGEYIYQTDLKGNAQTTLFINSFKFEYVPAIKDRAYFNHLFGKLQTYLFEKGDKIKENKFTLSSDNFNEILKSETEELFKNFMDSSGVEASFHIPSTLIDFFRTLSVKTENDVSLFDRGDGVQARFIPEILDEISGGSAKNIIWGFEEPENSYEVKNIRKLKDEFLEKYSRSKQIFITTHTKEFLSIRRKHSKSELLIENNKALNTLTKKEEALGKLRSNQKSSGVSLYRVWKNEHSNNTSLITRFDEKNNEWEKTCDDLGIIQEARIIEQLQEKLDMQAEEISNSHLSKDTQKKVNEELINDMRSCLERLSKAKSKIEEYEKPILIVEDKYDHIYKIAYLKLNSIEFTLENLDDQFSNNAPFIIRRGESAGSVAGILSMNNTDGYTDKKIIGLFDYDAAGSERFYQLKKQNNWDDIIHGDKETGFYKKRNQHDYFHALLVPVPKRLENLVSDIKEGAYVSCVEIENLVDEVSLVKHKLVDKKNLLGRDYYKIKDSSKGKSGKVFESLDKECYNDFIPLYGKVFELFSLV